MAKSKETKNQKIKITPAPGYLLLKPESVEKKTQSGIYLPDSAQGEKPQKGEVIAVGDDEILDSSIKRKSPVKKGDVVLYKKWGGNEVKLDNIEYVFIKFEDVLGIIN